MRDMRYSTSTPSMQTHAQLRAKIADDMKFWESKRCNKVTVLTGPTDSVTYKAGFNQGAL